MNKKRCPWAEHSQLERDYHDNEWGKPKFDDFELFELLNLEGQQSGLSWLTILKKREGYQKAFKQFNPFEIALFTQIDIERLLMNENIIRYELKIKAIIENAKIFVCKFATKNSFSNYIWSYVMHSPINNQFSNAKEVPSQTELSTRLSKDLKKMGFKFVGPTTVYAFMQAAGLVNDHLADCYMNKTIVNTIV